MGPAADTRAGNTEPDFRVIKQRFIDLNRLRLQRIDDDLRPQQRDFVALLPLLFHVNHPLLPGYVSRKAPAGIPDYGPTRATLAAARRVAKGFEFKKRAYRRFEIQSIFLMGSTGTIAYSPRSDFDVWVCHDSGLDQAQLDELHQKTDAIQRWATDLGVAVSVFLVDPDRFREGHYTRLSHESSGSALHFLLLDEFYRTGVVLAGRFPLWWMVPPEKEADYDNYVAALKQKRFIHGRDSIDLGGLSKIPAEEFYGATLWLLYKGIDSPYKSVLKILLMEIYASEFPDIDLLGLRFKQAVYDPERDLADLDPYIMMLERVEAYLISRDESDRLELARRCFYLKVGESLSRDSDDQRTHWRHNKLTAMSDKWGWHPSQWFMLDTREQWKLPRVKSERQALIGELMRSYRFLSDFARKHAGATSLIKPAELNVLGRKLYAAFKRKAGKIDIVYKGITSDLYEERVSIHRLLGDQNQEIWAVFSGLISDAERKYAQPLRRAHSLLELLAWCHFNKIVNVNTIIVLYAGGSDISEREVRALIEQLNRTFTERALPESNVDDFRQPVRTLAIATFINVGLDPFAAHTRKGQHLTSSHTDALKYGGLLENLALSIDQLFVTSWQEVLTFRYQGVVGLLDCMREYLNASPPSQGRRPPSINASSFSSMRSNAIARRVEQVFEDVISIYYDVAISKRTHYVIAAERNFYALQMHKDTLMYSRLKNVQQLYNFLAIPQREFHNVVFDRETLASDVLPVVFRKNTRDKLQYFYRPVGQEVEVFVLDERGSLFYQRAQVKDYICLLIHYQRFFQAVAERMRFLASESHVESPSNELEVYKLERNHEGKWNAERHTPVLQTRENDFISLQVIIEVVEGRTTHTIYCADSEFSTLEYGEALFCAVAKFILARRQGKSNYPIYITDLDLPKALQGDDMRGVQTIHYLQYKRRIEDKLNAEINRLM